MTPPEISFKRLKDLSRKDFAGIELAELFIKITLDSAKFLFESSLMVDLSSNVRNKKYVCFSSEKGKLTRPLNVDLFETDMDKIFQFCELFGRDKFSELPEKEISKMLYTMSVMLQTELEF